jgi:hypothetical protein
MSTFTLVVLFGRRFEDTKRLPEDIIRRTNKAMTKIKTPKTN